MKSELEVMACVLRTMRDARAILQDRFSCFEPDPSIPEDEMADRMRDWSIVQEICDAMQKEEENE